MGDLCLFHRVDSEKVLLGRVIQFSYLERSKKQREYSGTFVDMSIDSYKNIGVFANWFARQRNEQPDSNNLILFEPLDFVFTAGYLSMDNYIATIKDSSLVDEPIATIAIPSASLNSVFPQWECLLTLSCEFD